MLRRAALASLFLWSSAPVLAQPVPIEQPTDPRPEPPVDPKALLKELEQAGKIYGDAKRALSRGRADEALKALKKSSGALLGDRESLLKGDALLALGQRQAAEEAYKSAHDNAVIDAVRLRAARGLANVYAQLQNREEQLKSLEELLEVRNILRRSQIMMERAELLSKMGRTKEALDAAQRVVSDYPTARVAESARALLERLGKKGGVEAGSGRLELARIQNLIRNGESSKAKAALDELEKKSPEMAASIGLARADLAAKDRDRPAEIAALKAVLALDPDKETTRESLDRLGRTYMAIDQNEEAIATFDLLNWACTACESTISVDVLGGALTSNPY